MTQLYHHNPQIFYEGYDPNWIIGTQQGELPHSRGPLSYLHYMQPSNRRFFAHHDNRTIVTHNPYGRIGGHPGGPPVVVARAFATPGGPPVVVSRASVAPLPQKSVVTVVNPHAPGHTLGHAHGHKNMVTLRIPNCCEGCQEKWKEKLTGLPGFEGYNVEKMYGRRDEELLVTVFGNVDTHTVLKAVQKIQSRAELMRR